MPKIKICREEGCNNAATSAGYCRFHYLRNWKRLKEEKQKKGADRLNKYIERIVEKNPDRYMEVLKKEIRSKNFEKAIDDEFEVLDDLDDLLKIFNDPGYQSDIEQMIKNLKIDDE